MELKLRMDLPKLTTTFFSSVELEDPIEEEKLDQLLEMFCRQLGPIFSIDEEMKAKLIREVKRRVNMTLDVGGILDDGQTKPWTAECWRAEGTDRRYWQAYADLLEEKNWAKKVILGIDSKTDEILDRCGDPRDLSHAWLKRGLVIGDVQSGKTAVYTGLINKAVDAGYKVIIVLTGVLESLRKQTQERLDMEFVGRESCRSKKDKENGRREYGVGTIRNTGNESESVAFPIQFTSVLNDFGTASKRSNNVALNSMTQPVLFVIKKNSKILENLAKWLQEEIGSTKATKIHQPLLLIDDEADNASVNTNKADDSPTAVNRGIRSLLAQFHHASYVAFTATPFANVFIDPDAYDGELKDLFPSNFITCTSIPSNYFGVKQMLSCDSDDDFDSDGESNDTRESNPHLLIRIRDGETAFPLKHKKDQAKLLQLNDSLRCAIRQYLLINAIRDLREDTKETHRTMMVNLSRFTDAHDHMRTLINSYVHIVTKSVRVHGKSGDAEANPEIADLKNDFDLYFDRCGRTWQEVLGAFEKSNEGVKVLAINQKKKAELDYYGVSGGLRVIVIGGLGLARGVTLEGLCVSYLYRSTAFYDTLMQMGRWFGYRPDYGDLCKIWLSGDTINYYRQIAQATEELKDEVARMQEAGLSPVDFGLKVRDSPDALMITSSDKMRSAEAVAWEPTFSFHCVETPRLYRKDRVANAGAARELLDSIYANGIAPDAWGTPNRMIFRKVPKSFVANFIRAFTVHKSNYQLCNFNDHEMGIANFIETTTDPKLQEWEVAVWGKDSKDGPVCALNHLCSVGVLIRAGDEDAWNAGEFAINRNRIMGSEVEAAGISEDRRREIQSTHSQRVAGKVSTMGLRSCYRKERDKPLLVLLPILLCKTETVADENGKQRNVPGECFEQVPFITYALSFPAYGETHDAHKTLNKVKYRVNKTWVQEHFGIDADEGDEDAE